MKTNILFDAITGLIYFGIVYSLIKMVQPHGIFAVIGVLFGCTFVLYRFVYGIKTVKHYITALMVIATIVSAFYVAGKMGVIAALSVYVTVIIWVLYARRNKIKEAYKIFEEEADKVFFKEKVEEKPKVVKAKKPSRPTKKDKTEHKHKQKARKKNSHKASESSTVKKNSKNSAKKTTTK
jgi:Ca2+/Na+ antiporter